MKELRIFVFRSLEESFKMIQFEFDRMEKYWRNKLARERIFYKEHTHQNETKFQELQHQMKNL